MKRNKLSPFLLVSVITPLLACSSNTRHFEEKSKDDDLSVVKKSFDFVNTTDEYKIATESFDLYFVNGNDVPYISPYEYINGLKGLFYSIEDFNCRSYEKETSFVFKYLGTYEYFMTINWYSNYVYFSSIDFPSVIVQETGSTDYNAHLKSAGGTATVDPGVKIDLDAYYFDIYNYQNTCLIPLSIINILLGSPNYYNMIYNGDKVYGYYGEIYSGDKEYQNIYTSSLNNTEQSKAMREASFNSLCFSIDYFYGLKTNKSISSLSSYIKSTYKNQIMSTKASDNLAGYKGLLITQLDDLHSRLDSTSVYGNASVAPSISTSDLSKKWSTFYSTRNTLNGYKSSEWPETGEPDVRYKDDLAILNLNKFVTGTKDQIYDEQGKVKEDAYKYDTYWFMDHYLKEIGTHSEIKKVLIDLSTNGGGNIGAMLRAIGFLTNSNIPYNIMNTLTNRKMIYKYQIDTNNDDDYNDDDAYTNYSYTLLTSESTFSAANTFTSIFKELNIGKTIGHNSGGGMCSVLPLVLADGTFFAISSTSSIRYVVGNDFKSIEEGLTVDQTFDYSYFYNDSYLSNLLK